VGTILTETHPWVIATAMAVAMFVGWWIGWRRGRSQAREKREPAASKFGDACMAVLGLLLAFTFATAMSKHDQRRQMVLADSNSIGDFYTCASLLKDPPRAELQSVIREYAEHRLALAQQPVPPAQLQVQLDEVQKMHARMQTLVGAAVDGGTPVTVPLVNTLNQLTSNHAAHLHAYRDRLPPSIVALLALSAVIAMVLMGTQQGESQEQHFGAMIGFILLASMVMGVTLDLNQPERGWISVSQEPLQRVLSGMGK
jgi:hypothetical protein